MSKEAFDDNLLILASQEGILCKSTLQNCLAYWGEGSRFSVNLLQASELKRLLLIFSYDQILKLPIFIKEIRRRRLGNSLFNEGQQQSQISRQVHTTGDALGQ